MRDALTRHQHSAGLPGGWFRSWSIHCDRQELATRLEAATVALRTQGFESSFVTGGSAVPLGTAVSSATRVAFAVASSGPEAGPTAYLESSAELFGELTRHEVWAFIDANVDGAFEAVRRTLDCHLSPFSWAEMREIAGLNPMLREMIDSYRRNTVSLRGATLVFRDHLLLEKLNLLEALFQLGLRPQQTVVLSKNDLTFYRSRVAHHLRYLGATVIEPPPGTVEVPDWVDSKAGGPVVVVDDGADLVLSLLREGPLNRHFAVIETTAKGIRVLSQAGLVDKVINLSDTSTKRQMAQAIAASCVRRFRELLRHAPITSQRCLVVGYGLLGRHIAALLRQCSMDVRVVDIDPSARDRARADGFPIFSELDSGADSSVRYLFGCSGEQAVSLDVVRQLAPEVVLCALSSQDLVPAIAELQAVAEASPVRGIGTRYRFGGRTATVLADGHAVNLHYAEGVNEPDYDPFTTLIAVAVIESVRSLNNETVIPPPEALCAAAAALRVSHVDSFETPACASRQPHKR